LETSGMQFKQAERNQGFEYDSGGAGQPSAFQEILGLLCKRW